jgi:UDPglucose--hexose-1-phosphate uridylyltransferase
VIPPLQQEILEHDMIARVDEMCRFAIRIMPRLYRHGGLEASTGVYINPVLPELAAKLLRESSDE